MRFCIDLIDYPLSGCGEATIALIGHKRPEISSILEVLEKKKHEKKKFMQI